MLLKTKILNISTGKPIVILSKDTAERLHVHLNNRVEINKLKKLTPKQKQIFSPKLSAVVDISEKNLGKDQIGVSLEVSQKMNLKNKETVDVNFALTPISARYIVKRMENKELNYTEMYSIISDIINDNLSEPEITYFVSSLFSKPLTTKETEYMTQAMILTGNSIKWKEKFVFDKHCTGGVAGNRTSPIVIPIMASAIEKLGLDAVIPKTSSRAITSASGTADTMETISKIEFSEEKLKKIVKKTKGCLVWNSQLKLSPADSILIRIEKILSLESPSKVIASVLSKKISMGITHVILDLPIGPKFNLKESKQIKKKFKKVASKFQIKVKFLITNGKNPIGNGIGPVLEMRDIIKVLKQEKDRPLDLERKAIYLASNLLEMSGKLRKKDCFSLVKFLLYSGEAYKKFNQIIFEQGGNLKDIEKKLALAKFKYKVYSEKKGEILDIDNNKINFIARIAGSPLDNKAGIYLHCKVGKIVKKKELLFEIYAESQKKLRQAVDLCKLIKPIEISKHGN